jgi:hypothetical protein
VGSPELWVARYRAVIPELSTWLNWTVGLRARALFVKFSQHI